LPGAWNYFRAAYNIKNISLKRSYVKTCANHTKNLVSAVAVIYLVHKNVVN
jgi:hypothetical protein